MPIEAARRWGPEILLAMVAGAACFGFLGSTELWGKREQRASAEAIDTVDHGRWLVAQIQGRPRLEKPPLPRWATAALIALTGRRDEVIVRLPNALAALITVGLVYRLGRRLGGRAVGLASGFALASTAYFVAEMRQAGNDGFLTLFATLAMLAARERLDGGGGDDGRPGALGWAFAFHAAMGLGFLAKGPVILFLVGLPVVAYLSTSRRLGAGVRCLSGGGSPAVFVALALAWPVPVWIVEPSSARVWWLELAQKSGALEIPHDQARGSVALDWFWMTLPWTPLALLGAAGPFRRSSRTNRPGLDLGLAWWWAMAGLAVLAPWRVAKPSYYVPCLPGVALLVGSEWVRLAGLARGSWPGSAAARGVLQGMWVLMVVVAAVAAVMVGELAPGTLGWAVAGALVLSAAVVAGAWAWRKGSDALAIAATASGFVSVALIGYGANAPGENAARGHRQFARRLEGLIPAGSPTVWFLDEVDEGVGFYLRGHDLAPIAAPRFNRGFDLRQDAAAGKVDTPARRVDQARGQLADWARRADPLTPYALIRAKVYDRFAPEVADLVELIYREQGLKRNEMVLLRARATSPLAASTSAPARR